MNRKDKQILLGLVALLALLLAVSTALWYLKEEKTGFVPPEFDENAVSGTPQIPEGANYQLLDIKEGYKVRMCVNPTVSDGYLSLYFTSDPDNTLWVSAMILSEEGNILGRTGILRPGEYLTKVPVTGELRHGENVIVKILSYEWETYYSLGAANAQIQVNTQ